MYIFLTCAHRRQCFSAGFQHIFPFTFGINFVKIHLPKHPAQIWCVLSKFQIKKERVKGMETGWSADPTLTFKNLPEAHAFPYMVYGLDLQTCQVPSPWDSRLALTFRCPKYGSFRGWKHAQILSNYPNCLQTSGDIMENSITLVMILCGRGILLQCSGYFLGPNINI